MRVSVVAIAVGALVALLVFAVGTAITTFANGGTIWGVIALLVWGAIAFWWRPPRNVP